MFQDEETGQNYIWGYKPWEGDKFVPIEMQIGDNYSIYWSRESGVEGYKIFIDGDDSNYELNAGEYLYGDGEGDNEPRERAKNIDGSIDVTKTLPFRFQMVPNIVNWFLSKGARYAGYNENTYIYFQSSSSSGVDSLLEIIDSGVIYNSPYDQLKYVGPDTTIFKYLGDE